MKEAMFQSHKLEVLRYVYSGLITSEHFSLRHPRFPCGHSQRDARAQTPPSRLTQKEVYTCIVLIGFVNTDISSASFLSKKHVCRYTYINF
jgi:hypothetical protein